MFRKSPLEIVHAQLGNLASSLKNVSENINKSRNSFLRWSYGPEETNLCLTHVFSCCADLDYAYEELTKQLHAKNVEYRQSFKNIIEKEGELDKAKAKTAAEVKKLNQKIDRLTNEKRKKMGKYNIHEELAKLVQKIQDAANQLKKNEDEFESYKAKTLRDALIQYSSECFSILSKIQLIFQTRIDISKLMKETPIHMKDGLPDGNVMVYEAFKKVDLELPERKARFDRQQMEKAATLPQIMQMDVATRLSINITLDQNEEYEKKDTDGDNIRPATDSTTHTSNTTSRRLGSKKFSVEDTSDHGDMYVVHQVTDDGTHESEEEKQYHSAEDSSSDDQENEYHEADVGNDIYTYPDVVIGESIPKPRVPPGFRRPHSSSVDSTNEEVLEDPTGALYAYCDVDSATGFDPTGYLSSRPGVHEHPTYVNKNNHQQNKIEHSYFKESTNQEEIENTYFEDKPKVLSKPETREKPTPAARPRRTAPPKPPDRKPTPKARHEQNQS